MTGPFNAPAPSTRVTADGEFTLLDGATFLVSDRTGRIRPGGHHGLYVRDTRVLSDWHLTSAGVELEPLTAQPLAPYAARFVARARPSAGGDSPLLVVQERLVGDGLRETVTIENLAAAPAVVDLRLRIGADFADLFAVRAGAPEAEPPTLAVTGDELRLATGDGRRELRVRADPRPAHSRGELHWRAVVPARSTWSVEIIAEAVVDQAPVPLRFAPGQPRELTRVGRELAATLATGTTFSATESRLHTALRRSVDDLASLRLTDRAGHPYVAAGAPWYLTLFGRDSLLTAWSALPLDPDLALGTLRTLAARQGRRTDPATEEQPGRILHEVRHGPQHLTALGGEYYYGTVDATPLFVVLLGEVWRWGADPSVIEELLPAADAALSWLREHGDRDGDGLVEYHRATDRGLLNQGWKDSADGINDAAGRPGRSPIALAEVQGYAYAAFLARADLAAAVGDHATARRCRADAAALRQRFHERFWLPERGWYAVGLDRDKRPLDALTSNPGHCLWSGIVADRYAEQLIAALAELDSGFGLRTLGTGMAAYHPMSYHNGSVWPHDTALCVAGLLRYAHVPGAVALAHRLAEGLLAAAAGFGGRLPELYCGFPRDRYDPPIPYPTSCTPQAWASAAPLLLVRALLGLQPEVPARRLAVTPRLPESWGELRLTGLRLGDAVVDLVAHGDRAELTGVPADWSATAARDLVPGPRPPAAPGDHDVRDPETHRS